MKKILITILMIIPITVLAQNYEYIYDENYYIESENNEEFPYKSDISKIFVSEEQEEQPEEKPNRIIEQIKYNSYQQLKPIKRIIITNMSGGALIHEIEVYDKDEKQNYKYTQYNKKEYQELNDNDINTYIRVLNGDTIDIILDNEINPEDFSIVYKKSKYFGSISFQTKLYSNEYQEEYITSNFIYNKENEYIVLGNYLEFTDSNIIEKKLIVEQNSIKKYNYKAQEIITQEELNEIYYYKTKEIIRYKYTDILFKYYKIKEIKEPKQEKITTNKPIIKKISTKKVDNIINKEKLTQKVNKSKQEEKIKQSMSPIKAPDNTIKMSKIENKKMTKTNKITYIIPVIILMLLSLMGYTLHSLIKER